MSSFLGFTLGTENLGTFTWYFGVTVGGTSRLTGFTLDEFAIHLSLGLPSVLTARVVGFTPTVGQEVRVTNGGTGSRALFAGHIIDAKLKIDRQTGDRQVWEITCQDYSWLLDRYARVTAVYEDIGYNVCARRIVDAFTNGGFAMGYCPSNLGTVTRLQFSQATVRQALERVAADANGYLDVDAEKHVNIFTTPDHLSATAISFTNTSKNFAHLDRTLDYTDIATRVECRGGGGQTTARVQALTPVIPVTECKWYDQYGGTIIVNDQELVYISRSANSGPGDLTMFSSIPQDIPENTQVDTFVRLNNTTAQTALSTILGGGLSGVSIHYEANADWTLSEATSRATKVLADRAYGAETILLDMYDDLHTSAQHVIPGKTVSVSMTNPITISNTFRVQRVVLKPRTTLQSTSIGVVRSLTLGNERRDLSLVNVLTAPR